jgi:hypothetical protein
MSNVQIGARNDTRLKAQIKSLKFISSGLFAWLLSQRRYSVGYTHARQIHSCFPKLCRCVQTAELWQQIMENGLPRTKTNAKSSLRFHYNFGKNSMVCDICCTLSLPLSACRLLYCTLEGKHSPFLAFQHTSHVSPNTSP